LSLILLNSTSQLLPEILPMLFPIDPIDPIPTPSTATKSLLHFSTNTHNHHYHYPKPQMSNWGKFGIGLGVFTLAVGSFTAYNTHVQAQASVLQAQAALKQLFESERLNDLQEVSNGLMSKETYVNKWKN